MGGKSKYVISHQNENILNLFENDFKIGRNVSVSRGGRSELTLRKNRNRMKAICYFLEKEFGVMDVRKVSEEQILTLFERLEKGSIKTITGKIMRSVASYQATFKAFWRWHIKRSRKELGKNIPDICADFILQHKRPEFTYFSKDNLSEMSKIAKQHYRVLMWFLFDSGIRPQEMKKLLVEDLILDNHDVLHLNIRNQIAKKGSFGRKIKLLLCKDLLLQYIKDKEPKDLLFPSDPRVINQYIGRLSMKIIGKKVTMYDFRHASCCYWINIYKKDQALKYRMGWKNGDMIEYYSRYIGLKDELTEEDLLSNESRTKLEKEIGALRIQAAIREDEHKAELSRLNSSFDQIKKKMDQLLDLERISKLLEIESEA